MRPLFALGIFACCHPVAAQSSWSAAVPVPELNSSAASDLSPSLSADELTMMLASFRAGDWDVFSATRSDPSMPFSMPQRENVLSLGGATDAGPFLRSDGLEVFFHSARSGLGRFEIMRATRATTASSWGTPSFVAELNDPSGSSADISLTGDGLTAFFISTQTGSPGGGGNGAIWTATRPATSNPFSAATLVAEVSSTQAERDVEISHDGLTMVFARQNRSGGGSPIMMATRLNTSSPFGTPVQVAGFAGLGPTLNRAGNELYFCQNLGSPTFYDVFVASFDGLTSSGVASTSNAATLHYRDSTSAGLPYAATLALGANGFSLGGRQVPLDPDPLFFAAFGGIPGLTTGFVGLLDGTGEATGTIVTPFAALAGLTLHAGFFALEGGSPFGIKTISNARAVELQ